jgi:hypothetical protein
MDQDHVNVPMKSGIASLIQLHVTPFHWLILIRMYRWLIMEEMIPATHVHMQHISDRSEWWSQQTPALLLVSSSPTRQVHRLQHTVLPTPIRCTSRRVAAGRRWSPPSTSVRGWSHGNDMRRHGLHSDGLEMRPAAARQPRR